MKEIQDENNYTNSTKTFRIKEERSTTGIGVTDKSTV